ncbi:MAG: condensation domain-containing protein, partial [Acidobacteria bacterium]|nr:condensation domain-containing protein [Acidobacteriota bacterium]
NTVFPGQGQARLINAYGPTEATVDVTHFDCSSNLSLPFIPIGKPMSNVRIFILDRFGDLQVIGIPGELCIAGDCLAQGYLNNPELTRKKFRPLMPQITQMTQMKNKSGALRALNGCPRRGFQHSAFSIQHSNLYCTGDLARWLPAGPPAGGASGGVIEFLGRIDHQVKIRGFRVEPGEIESRLLKYPGLNEAVVSMLEDDNKDKYLCAYVVFSSEGNTAELREYLALELPDYMIPSYFVTLDKIPLTSHGKIDRRALPSPGADAGVNYTAPGNEIEKKLAALWSEVLGQGQAQEQFSPGIDDNFFQLGGHSLKAINMAAKIHKEFNVKIPLAEIFNNPTIRTLSGFVKKASGEKFTAIRPAEEKEFYPLTTVQKRIYVVHRMQAESKSYNISTILALEGKLDYERLENAFRQLLNRHESLRTSFLLINGEAVQVIHKEVAFNIEWYESGKEHVQDIVENFIRPFDLTRAPLLRVGLIKISEMEHVLMVDMHHIAADGVSHKIMTNEFFALYRGEDLMPLKLRCRDFSEWQNLFIKTAIFKKQEEYWLQRYKNDIPVLNLPTDYPRGSGLIPGDGNTIEFPIGEAITKKLYTLVKNTGVTVYMFLLAVYTILLSKFSGQTDIIVVSPVTGRSHSDLENIIGMFVNMLAMRNRPTGEKTFSQFLEEVKTDTLRAYENQDYPINELVSKLGLQGSADRNPLLNTVFTMQNLGQHVDAEKVIPGLKISPFEYNRKTSIFDLHLIVSEHNEKIGMAFEYAAWLFKDTTIRHIADHFLEIITKVLENPDIKLNDIALTDNVTIVKPKEIIDHKDFGF